MGVSSAIKPVANVCLKACGCKLLILRCFCLRVKYLFTANLVMCSPSLVGEGNNHESGRTLRIVLMYSLKAKNNRLDNGTERYFVVFLFFREKTDNNLFLKSKSDNFILTASETRKPASSINRSNTFCLTFESDIESKAFV